MNKIIILTVQPLSNKKKDYRLGMNTNDFNAIEPFLVKIKKLTIELNFGQGIILLDNSLETYRNYGNFVNSAISKWIMENNYHLRRHNKICKLIFEQKVNLNHHHYIIYPNQK